MPIIYFNYNTQVNIHCILIKNWFVFIISVSVLMIVMVLLQKVTRDSLTAKRFIHFSPAQLLSRPHFEEWPQYYELFYFSEP